MATDVIDKLNRTWPGAGVDYQLISWREIERNEFKRKRFSDAARSWAAWVRQDPRSADGFFDEHRKGWPTLTTTTKSAIEERNAPKPRTNPPATSNSVELLKARLAPIDAASAIEATSEGLRMGHGQQPTGLDFSRILKLTGQDADRERFSNDHRDFERDANQLAAEKKTWALCAVLDHANVDAKIYAARALLKLADPDSVPALLAAAKRNNYGVEGSENATLHSIYRSTLKQALEIITGLSLTPKDLKFITHQAGQPPKEIRSDEHPEQFTEAVDFGAVERWLRRDNPEKAAAIPRDVRQEIDRLTSDDPKVRAQAAHTLGLKGARAELALPDLLKLLGDETHTEFEVDGEKRHTQVSKEANEALAKLGEPAVEPLIARLDNINLYVRINATRALGRIGDKRSVEALNAIIIGQKWGCRESAHRALRKLGIEDAVGALAKLLQDPKAAVRLRALGALGYSQAPVALDAPRLEAPVVAILKNIGEEQNVRLAAARVLRLYKTAPALDALEAVLKGDAEAEALRTEAAKSLALLGSPGILRLLRLERTGDADERRLATGALWHALRGYQSSYGDLDACHTLEWEIYSEALREVVGARVDQAALDEIARGTTPSLHLLNAIASHPNPIISAARAEVYEIADDRLSLHPVVQRFGKSRREDTHPWGEAVEGLQCRARWRLRTSRPQDNVYDPDAGIPRPPVQVFDLRNQGDRDWRFLAGPEDIEYEVGERTYRHPITTGDIPRYSLTAGAQRTAIRLPPLSSLRGGDPPLPLAPGKHRMRVTLTVHPANDAAGAPVRISSNPFEAAVLPAGKERYEGKGFKLEAGFFPDKSDPEITPDLFPPGFSCYHAGQRWPPNNGR